MLHTNINGVHQLLAAGLCLTLFVFVSFDFLLGADASLVDDDGNTPLHSSTILMSKSNQSSILYALVSHQPNLLCQKNRSDLIPLHIALKNFDYQSIGYLMPEQDGQFIEQAQRSLLLLDSFARHSLHYAANSGLTTFIERHFKQMNREIINQKDSFGLTPLHYAW